MRGLHLKRGLFVYGLAGLIAWSTQAQTRLGPELHLNSQVGSNLEPDIAVGPDGMFMADWIYAPDPSGGPQNIVARRFSSSGFESREVTLVKASAPFHPVDLPRIVPALGGGWTLFYTQYHPTGYRQVYAARFSEDGSPLGKPFVAGKSLPSFSDLMAAKVLPSGGYFFAAEDSSCPGCPRYSEELFARVLDSQGQALSPYFLVGTGDRRTSLSGPRSIGVDGAGNVTVAWETQQGVFVPKQTAILAQRFSPAGEQLGDPFLVNKRTSSFQFAPSVAANPNGDFMIVWQYQAAENAPRSIWARRFSKNGKPVGGEFIIAGDPLADVVVPSIAADPQGNFIVVWTDLTSFLCHSVRGRLYHPDGTPFGAAFPLASSTDSCDELPQVAFGPDGVFGAVWTRDLDDGGSDIFAALFRVDP
jgi:hypothetical protein